MGEPRGYHGCTVGGMFGEGSLDPGGPGRRHRAHSPLLGAGNVPGTGLAGCPGSQTGVSASSGTGHGQWCGLLPPQQEKGRITLAPCELPTSFGMAPVPANCWPDTASLHRSFTVQDGSWGRAPGWVLGRASQTSLDTHVLQCAGISTVQGQDRNHIKRSRLSCQCWHRDIFWLSL